VRTATLPDIMTKLNQIIAVEKGIKGPAQRVLTDSHHLVLKLPLLSGIARTYQPKEEDGEPLPPESTLVQVKAEDILRTVAGVLAKLFDVTATKDWANCEAKADVEVDGRILLPDVPVTFLLFLEKQLVDLHTFVRKLPVLDAAETWTFDETAGQWRTDSVQTVRTKKVPRNHVKAEATERHPAQVEMYYEDVPAGHWTTVRFSGALPATRVRELTERVEKLLQAVKFAREEANSREIADRAGVGTTVFGYLFG
jgi:hypothetical protein